MRRSQPLIIVIVLTVILLLLSSPLPNIDVTELPWHLKQIDVVGAWNIADGGNPNLTIAVIDSGIDFYHPKLVHSQWINLDEIVDNGLDDDRNGYVDDGYGWDFVSDDNTPGWDYEDPINSHGTFIAGIIAARNTTNRRMIIGISNNVKIMDIRILNQTGHTAGLNWTQTMARALRYAITNGADVISLSIQFPIFSEVIKEAMDEAININIPVVSITGNSFVNDTGKGLQYSSFPGAYDNVIAVGATNFYYGKADYANYGSSVELVAPVGDHNAFDNQKIRSTSLYDDYAYGIGTSFAAPQVAATIALMKSVNDELSVEGIREILHTTAIDLGEVGWASLQSIPFLRYFRQKIPD
ncbi:MAG: S8 family serine peptidase [Candidatus Thorarchaeota archaeon]